MLYAIAKTVEKDGKVVGVIGNRLFIRYTCRKNSLQRK